MADRSAHRLAREAHRSRCSRRSPSVGAPSSACTESIRAVEE